MNERELKRRRRRRQRRIRTAILLLSMICVLGLFGFAAWKLIGSESGKEQEKPVRDTFKETETMQDTAEAEESEIQTETPTETQLNSMPGLQAVMDSLYSASAEVIRVDDWTVITEKASRQRVYPASLTKIMTALTVMQSLEDLQEAVIVSADMFEELYAQNASLSGFAPGEAVSAKDLLYGVMLPSGAESCIALAERVAGSEEGFVKLMNEKAQELGMTETHFMNASGLHSTEHYTTVHDLGILLKEALENETFREIFVSQYYTTQPTVSSPDGITFEASVFKNMNENQKLRAAGVIKGGKTGYTEEAGLCLASMGLVGQEEFLVITTGAQGSFETVQFNIEDALNIYEAIGSV